MISLESMIAQENPVRLIDALAEKLELEKLGFTIAKLNTQGRPAFDSRVFLKIYFYGYVNVLRSSRKLEKECNRNIEMQWLTGKLTPNYHSIVDFRKINPDALHRTFKLFVSFLKDADLIVGEVVAIDGTRVRTQKNRDLQRLLLGNKPYFNKFLISDFNFGKLLMTMDQIMSSAMLS